MRTLPNKSEKRILLIIEDIDRCSENKIIEVVDALRIILEDKELYQRVVIISAIDERILERAIKIKYAYVQEENEKKLLVTEYIDKLFLIAIQLPKLTEDEKIEIFESYTDTKCTSKSPPPAYNAKETQQDKAEIVNNGNNTELKDDIEWGDLGYEITLKEQRKLTNSLKFLKNATPRSIKIFYYRYLLARNLFWIEHGKNKEKLQKIIEGDIYEEILLLLIIKRTEFNNQEDMNAAISVSGQKIVLYNQTFILTKTQYQILLKIINVVVAY